MCPWESAVGLCTALPSCRCHGLLHGSLSFGHGRSTRCVQQPLRPACGPWQSPGTVRQDKVF